MNAWNHQWIMVWCIALTVGLAGCGKSGNGGAASPTTFEQEHEHASTGPHGGSLIELGEEEYHAELVHDDAAGTVTVYLLDSAAKARVPIDAPEVTINLKHDGRGEQFQLVATPDQTDPAGTSSRFVSNDAELAEDLDHDDAEPQLVVTIQGTQYRGAIEHDHDAEGQHDHAE